MNKQRRIEIKHIIDELEVSKDKINIILSDEQDYYDNMPENLHGSIRGMESEEYIDILSDVIESMDDIIECIRQIC